MAITYRNASSFHPTFSGEHATLEAARKQRAQHAQGCTCGLSTVAVGSEPELRAAGAYDSAGGNMILDLDGEYLSVAVRQ